MAQKEAKANEDMADQVEIGVVASSNKNIPFINVKRLSDKAKLPKRMFPHSAGYDLFSAIDTKVPARGKAMVPTDLSIDMPHGAYGRIAARSGLAWHHSIEVGGGVVDADKNPVFVILYNHSDIDYQVKVGDNVAQMVIELNATPEIVEVDEHTTGHS